MLIDTIDQNDPFYCTLFITIYATIFEALSLVAEHHNKVEL